MYTLALLLPALVAAQNASQLAGLLSSLQAAGLTSLATAAQQIANTTTGQGLIPTLFSGPVTVFAPDNNAFTGVPANISGNPDLLAEVLSYHIVPGTFNLSAFPASASGPTVLKTALNASDQVFLGPGNQRQALAIQTIDGRTRVLNQNTDVTVLNSTTAGNFTVNVVNAVIDLPGDMTAAFQANNLSTFATAAGLAGIIPTLNLTHGLTIFAPSNAAFAKLSGVDTQNATLVKNVLLNHVLNGSVIYGGELTGNETTAGGQPMALNGQNITVGNTTATVTKTDLITWSGVIHIIDTVLLDANFSQEAASSAQQSATSAAASEASVQATATGPATAVGTNGGASSAPASSSGAASSLIAASLPGSVSGLAVLVMGVLGGALML